MNCLKCGREIPEHQVFCEDCLLVMQKYPVPPDTVVQIPRRTSAPVRKTVKKRSIPLEEQVKKLTKSVHILTLALILASALIAILIPTAVSHWMEERYEVGQNYTAITSTTEPEETRKIIRP